MTVQRFKRSFLGLMESNKEGEWVKQREVAAFLELLTNKSAEEVRQAWEREGNTRKRLLALGTHSYHRENHFTRKRNILFFLLALSLLFIAALV